MTNEVVICQLFSSLTLWQVLYATPLRMIVYKYDMVNESWGRAVESDMCLFQSLVISIEFANVPQQKCKRCLLMSVKCLIKAIAKIINSKLSLKSNRILQIKRIYITVNLQMWQNFQLTVLFLFYFLIRTKHMLAFCGVWVLECVQVIQINLVCFPLHLLCYSADHYHW